MGIRIKKEIVVYDSITGIGIEPNYLFNADKVKEYLKIHKFPEGEYTSEDLFYDTQSTGVWMLPEYITNEQIKYIGEMCNEMI